MSNFYPAGSAARAEMKGKVSVENLPFAKLKNPSQAKVQLQNQNLESFGIKDGDFLVFDFNEKVKNKSFAMVWRENDYHCYFVESIRGEKVYLANDIRKFTVKPSDILGGVIRMERDL